jgi:hypothetical protein
MPAKGSYIEDDYRKDPWPPPPPPPAGHPTEHWSAHTVAYIPPGSGDLDGTPVITVLAGLGDAESVPC